jgi:hypothetical protein
MNDKKEIYRAKVNLETSTMLWKDLQRYFAGGVVLQVADGIDIVEVAYQMAEDNAPQIQEWMMLGQLGKVSDEQAAIWFATDAVLWTVVVSPWVLVQIY